LGELFGGRPIHSQSTVILFLFLFLFLILFLMAEGTWLGRWMGGIPSHQIVYPITTARPSAIYWKRKKNLTNGKQMERHQTIRLIAAIGFGRWPSGRWKSVKLVANNKQ